jgi:RNA polymerase sigma-70 factor, ECF subfamily
MRPPNPARPGPAARPPAPVPPAPLPPAPLPPAQWTVLILRDVLHWPAAEAAALLGVGVPALDSALDQARAAVREGRSPTGAERAALSRLVGTRDGAVLALTGALLREHAPPAPRGA